MEYGEENEESIHNEGDDIGECCKCKRHIVCGKLSENISCECYGITVYVVRRSLTSALGLIPSIRNLPPHDIQY